MILCDYVITFVVYIYMMHVVEAALAACSMCVGPDNDIVQFRYKLCLFVLYIYTSEEILTSSINRHQ